MNKLFGSLYAQFSQFFKTLSPTKRMSLIASIVVGGVALVVVGVMVSGRDYVVLFQNIPNEQVPIIIGKLQEKNIPFRLGDGGQSVHIPKELLHSTQMTLMTEVGSEKMGSLGLELFEKTDFTQNSFNQKVNYQRALQGELMRAINTISAVRQSKVLLAIPNKKTFLEESNPPSASVVLKLHAGKMLTPDQVRGIRFLVASAVEGMDADRVTVVDERGKVLSRSGDSAANVSGDLMEIKSKVEEELENKIDAILSKVVGQAKVIAKVDATLNHRVTTSMEEVVDPEKTAIRSVTSEEESLDGARTNASGAPGARANLPDGIQAQGQIGFEQNVKKELKTTNYEVPKTVRNIKEGAGNIDRISVAVLVDGITTFTTKEDGTTESQYTPRSQEEIAKYEALVKNAIGFNAARGDTVKIENIQFAQEDFSEAERVLTNLERKKLLQAFLKWSLVGFALALFFFIVIRPFMQWVTDSFQDSVEDMLPRTIEELEELQSVDNTLPGMSTALPVLEDAIDPDKAESELLKDRILDLMNKDEEKASNALGLWLVRKDDQK